MLQNVLGALMFCGSLFAIACGGAASAQDICDEACAKQASCNSWTTDQKTTCENACTSSSTNGSDEVQMAKDDCKNSDTVINAYEHCFTSYCAEADIQSCVTTAAGKCEAK